MKPLSALLAILIGFLLGAFLESNVISQIGFIATGLCAGAVAQIAPKGAERPYWIFVVVVLVLVILSYFGVSLSRLWFILPLTFILAYFAARLVLKFQKDRSRRFR